MLLGFTWWAPRSGTLPIDGLGALETVAALVISFASVFSWGWDLFAELAVGRIILARKPSLTGLALVSLAA